MRRPWRWLAAWWTRRDAEEALAVAERRHQELVRRRQELERERQARIRNVQIQADLAARRRPRRDPESGG